jgi:putative phosphoribosyl transferase
MDRGVEHESEDRLVHIPAGLITLEGNLEIPSGAQGIVLFAHGSGSSRFSPRNRFVASVLQEAGLATLLIDLLTSEEEAVDRRTREFRFDIDRLAYRLVHATDWLERQPETQELNIGYFGASTGAAAALVAASEKTEVVDAVVSRGGRPDLAGPILGQVRAPTLLIVGSRDYEVRRLNERALDRLPVEKKIEIVPGATHLFEEPAALEQVASLARDWFEGHLVRTQERMAIA